MKISFTKMHGLGNDFVIINALNHSFNLQKNPIIQLSDRHRGIGFDQLLIIESFQQDDFFCRIFNADGTEAEQCGNGLRCVARFIVEENLHPSNKFNLKTLSGIYPAFVRDFNQISVMMGAPQIKKSLIDLQLIPHAPAIPVSILSLGNPHAIVKVQTIDDEKNKEIASLIANHSFPNGVNVGFVEVMNPQHIRLRTFERGVGETHACGSNASAAIVAGITNGWLSRKVEVELRYGSLQVEWEGDDKPVKLIGPAERVFNGVLM